ncbi:hypothetical protein CCP1ISM_60044 [Azospirillaceae bacterium]
MRLREIKKYAGLWVVKLSPLDITDFGLIEGDKVDIEDLNLLKEKSLKNEMKPNYLKPSEKQLDFLKKNKIKYSENITRKEASNLITEFIKENPKRK